MGKKRPRISKMRGTREHGRGRKKGRGAGLRGGRGHAGSLNHKFVHYLKYEPDHFAHRRGFKTPAAIAKHETTVNLVVLGEQLHHLVAAGAATQSGEGYEVDLGAAGFTKLVGSGQVRAKFAIKVGRATPGAVAKVEAAGGSVTQTNPPPPPKPPKEKPGAKGGGKGQKKQG